MIIIGAVTSTALLVFCARAIYRAGVKRGATYVLSQWKESLPEVDNKQFATYFSEEERWNVEQRSKV